MFTLIQKREREREIANDYLKGEIVTLQKEIWGKKVLKKENKNLNIQKEDKTKNKPVQPLIHKVWNIQREYINKERNWQVPHIQSQIHTIIYHWPHGRQSDQWVAF